MKSSTHTTGTTKSKNNRQYRIASNKFVARDLAALDFMLNIPLASEQESVTQGYSTWQRRHEYSEEDVLNIAPKGQWWEKWVKRRDHMDDNTLEPLEQPSQQPGRRLDGLDPVKVQIPLTTATRTKQRSIARQAALREWELETAHGLGSRQAMLDGRLFFSAKGAYPMGVFSVIRYEPRKEEAALRRQKLEARGGGGSSFVIPARDWRGISYRALLPRRQAPATEKQFNRFLRSKEDDEDSDDTIGSSSSEDSDEYEPGLLDDPEMTLGRHRNVMVGDCVTGPIVSSTIQFVKPAILKEELNKQFRERFDGWEPPKSARQYIGAKVMDGEYRLMEPSEEYGDSSTSTMGRRRQGSVTSVSSAMTSETGGSTAATPGTEKLLRMPPSLTLSKIRSLKHQALLAAVKANLEISTVALACVYFERLALDCRVDKSNRRVSFAACLLLATKINEPNVGLVMMRPNEEVNEPSSTSLDKIQSLVKPNKRSSTMFASLLEFFTQQWSLSLKHLFAAEFGVFAALSFDLHAKPSQVAFHFRRLMKTLEWNAPTYLGETMYRQWQDALDDEDERREQRELRREKRHIRKEEQILNLHIEIENEARRRMKDGEENGDEHDAAPTQPAERAISSTSAATDVTTPVKDNRQSQRKGLLKWVGLRRAMSQERLNISSEHVPREGRKRWSGLTTSPSMPQLPVVEIAVSEDVPVLPLGTEDIEIFSQNAQDDNFLV